MGCSEISCIAAVAQFSLLKICATDARNKISKPSSKPKSFINSRTVYDFIHISTQMMTNRR